MQRRNWNGWAIAAAACVAIGLAGCGQVSGRGSVNGSVTYEGQPLEAGSISFLPADGKGASVGGQIKAGAYSVSNVPPGKKIVEIVSEEASSGPMTSEQAAQMANANAGKPTRDIPNAVGNNQQQEVVVGAQTLDFNLTKAK